MTVLGVSGSLFLLYFLTLIALVPELECFESGLFLDSAEAPMLYCSAVVESKWDQRVLKLKPVDV